MKQKNKTKNKKTKQKLPKNKQKTNKKSQVTKMKFFDQKNFPFLLKAPSFVIHLNICKSKIFI